MVLKRGRLIGLTGAAGCGKTTARDELISYGWSGIKFAGPLKSMARELFVECGLDPDMCIDGDMKEVNMPELNGKSPRYIMQTLGTEWGRDCVSSNFWVDITRRKCASLIDGGNDVIVDDVRFQNEADMIRDMGGVVCKIIGRGGIDGSHSSEMGVHPDMTIANIGTIEAFRNDIGYILHRTDYPE